MAEDSASAMSEMIDALQDVLRQVSEPVQVLRVILEQAVARSGAERGLFVEIADAGRLEYRVLHGFQPEQLTGEADRFSRSLFARVLETGDDVMLASVADEPEFNRVESVQALHIAAVLCMPIRAAGSVAALVHLEHRKEGHFNDDHRHAVRGLLDVAGRVLETLQTGRNVMDERDRLRLSETRLRDEAEENRRLLARDWSFGRFVGRSPAVRTLEKAVQQVAATDFPVLLLGETGTGKSIIARVIHYAGKRAARPLVTVFCPSLEKSMVEAELFGHRRGAFTGATEDRPGKVQAAEGGTLFLDEIGELPLDIQPKLLRLLQEATYERVGEAKERKADIRVIAASHRDLEVEVAQGRFRRDLFERLNYVPVRIPPLRERTEDIPLLLRHALDRTEAGRWIEISEEGTRALRDLDFAWPGNVRHLEQLAARLSLDGAGTVGAKEILARLGADRAAAGAPVAKDLSAGLPSLLEEAERTWLEEALRVYPHLSRADLAARLKIAESTLYKKLRQYGLGS